MNQCDIIDSIIYFGGGILKIIFLDFDGVINNWDCFDGVSIDNAIILKKILLE